ncbi:hypothetical protein I314_02675 [Cryptococcus bacillisporus CA1873]|uniref:Uncharacterized protein n=1 Tax=Cryptococcus bacillisporus CA1873 TaxID=1296111 RepID=A0ABR5BC61_CRYGA|nr:hypothetical protein I314_02675 [Cryptococcus bacillisporus CA1873]|eukprot:KIR63894.1 hypothetical protein I314_02675 [Cryptococcus gattii CA1873]
MPPPVPERYRDRSIKDRSHPLYLNQSINCLSDASCSTTPSSAASTLSGPASSLAAAAAATKATFATPLREGDILRRISQPEVGSPPNDLPASPAASLPSNSSAVAPQQPASPSPALSAQGKAKNKATGNKSKPADSSQQGKPRFQ